MTQYATTVYSIKPYMPNIYILIFCSFFIELLGPGEYYFFNLGFRRACG